MPEPFTIFFSVFAAVLAAYDFTKDAGKADREEILVLQNALQDSCKTVVDVLDTIRRELYQAEMNLKSPQTEQKGRDDIKNFASSFEWSTMHHQLQYCPRLAAAKTVFDQSRVPGFEEHREKLAQFLQNEGQTGNLVVEFLSSLANCADDPKEKLIGELQEAQKKTVEAAKKFIKLQAEIYDG